MIRSWWKSRKIFPWLTHGGAHVKSPHDMIMAIFLLLHKYLFDRQNHILKRSPVTLALALFQKDKIIYYQWQCKHGIQWHDATHVGLCPWMGKVTAGFTLFLRSIVDSLVSLPHIVKTLRRKFIFSSCARINKGQRPIMHMLILWPM